MVERSTRAARFFHCATRACFDTHAARPFAPPRQVFRAAGDPNAFGDSSVVDCMCECCNPLVGSCHLQKPRDRRTAVHRRGAISNRPPNAHRGRARQHAGRHLGLARLGLPWPLSAGVFARQCATHAVFSQHHRLPICPDCLRCEWPTLRNRTGRSRIEDRSRIGSQIGPFILAQPYQGIEFSGSAQHGSSGPDADAHRRSGLVCPDSSQPSHDGYGFPPGRLVSRVAGSRQERIPGRAAPVLLRSTAAQRSRTTGCCRGSSCQSRHSKRCSAGWQRAL